MEREIDLKRLFTVLKQRIGIIIAITLISALIGGMYSVFLKTPIYSVSTRLLIQAGGDSAMANTLRVMVNEPIILEKVAAELNTDTSANALRGQISLENVSDSQVVKINVIDQDPEMAAKIANTTANVYKQEVATLFNFQNISILTPAVASQYAAPININHTQTILIALLIGLVLSVGITFLLNSFDDTVKSERTIEEILGAPVLGSVSKMKNKGKKRAGQEAFVIRSEIVDSNS